MLFPGYFKAYTISNTATSTRPTTSHDDSLILANEEKKSLGEVTCMVGISDTLWEEKKTVTHFQDIYHIHKKNDKPPGYRRRFPKSYVHL